MCSLQDFDSTGLYHEQYAAKWISCLSSVNSRRDQLQSTSGSRLANPVTVCIHCFADTYPPASVRLLLQKVDSYAVKDSFDTMLKKWKPKTFKPTKVEGKIPVIVRYFGHYMAAMNP